MELMVSRKPEKGEAKDVLHGGRSVFGPSAQVVLSVKAVFWVQTALVGSKKGRRGLKIPLISYKQRNLLFCPPKAI